MSEIFHTAKNAIGEQKFESQASMQVDLNPGPLRRLFVRMWSASPEPVSFESANAVATKSRDPEITTTQAKERNYPKLLHLSTFSPLHRLPIKKSAIRHLSLFPCIPPSLRYSPISQLIQNNQNTNAGS